MDRLHATYWMKACSFINPYWHVWEGKLAKINFQKARMWAKKTLSNYSHKYILVPFIVYVHTYVATYVPSVFSLPTHMCNWLASIAMPCLDIDITRRLVFLQSTTGYRIASFLHGVLIFAFFTRQNDLMKINSHWRNVYVCTEEKLLQCHHLLKWYYS